jgi:phosphatidylglycerol---prolipoprotein diacylglyceryl transferase
MLPVIHIGSAAIQSIVLALLIAVWLSAYVSERACQSKGIAPDHAWNIVGIGVAATIFSARTIFVLQNWGAYANDGLQILSPTPNALALDDGMLLGGGVALAYSRWRKIPFARFADALAPGALAAIAVIAFGQFLSGDAYGTPTDLPWAISLWGEPIHPVQLYDALGALMGAVIVWRWRTTRDGLIALMAIAWYSAVRLFIEAFRGDVTLIGNGYRLSQIIALVVLLIALRILFQRRGLNA